MASPGHRRFSAAGPWSHSTRDGGSRLSLICRARLFFILAWCALVDPFTTAAGCGFEHSVGLVLELSG